MARNLILTEAGADLFIDEGQGGSAAVTIDAVKLGDAAYTPTASQTAMQGAVLRTITPTAGGSPDDNVIHLAIQDDDPAYAYSAYEIGVFSGSTLVAIYSVGAGEDPVIVKTADSTVWLTIDIVLTPGATRDVTIAGDITLDVNQASTTKKGTVYLATAAEAAAGSNALKAITPSTLKGETDKLVTLATAQSITAKKTFTVSPAVPTPPALASLAAEDDSKPVNVAWIKALLLALHPVGSYYMTEGSENPGNLFGGTWTKVQNSFLIGTGTRSAGATGGADSVTLTVANLPSHTHAGSVSSSGAHTHSGTTAADGGHSHTVSVTVPQTACTCANAGKHTHTATTGSAGGHTHTVSVTVPQTACTCATAGKHSHTVTVASAGKHSHGRGTMEITGTLRLTSTGTGASAATGAFSVAATTTSGDDQNGKSKQEKVTFKASSGWSGATAVEAAHTHTATCGDYAAHSHTVTLPQISITNGSAASAGAHTHSLTTSEQAAHSHTVTLPSISITNGSAANVSNHTHTFSISSSGAHTHTFTTNATGSGTAFSILPTFRAVHIWRRTA